MPCSFYLPSLCGTLFVKLDFETLGSWYLDHTCGVGIICVWMTALLYNRLEAAVYTAVVGCHVFQLCDTQLKEHGGNLRQNRNSPYQIHTSFRISRENVMAHKNNNPPLLSYSGPKLLVIVHSSVRPLSFVRVFSLLARSFVRSIRSLVRSFAQFVSSIVLSFVQFARSLVRSFARSFVCSFNWLVRSWRPLSSFR